MKARIGTQSLMTVESCIGTVFLGGWRSAIRNTVWSINHRDSRLLVLCVFNRGPFACDGSSIVCQTRRGQLLYNVHVDDRSSLIDVEEQPTSLATPARLPHWLSRLRSYFVLDPLIFSYTCLLGSASFVASFADHGGSKQHAIARTWSRWILATSMCPVRVVGLDRVDTSRPAVYAAN